MKIVQIFWIASSDRNRFHCQANWRPKLIRYRLEKISMLHQAILHLRHVRPSSGFQRNECMELRSRKRVKKKLHSRTPKWNDKHNFNFLKIKHQFILLYCVIFLLCVTVGVTVLRKLSFLCLKSWLN